MPRISPKARQSGSCDHVEHGGWGQMHERLVQVLRRPDTVLFVGSGASVWSGLPSWTRLLDDLANYLETIGRDASLVRREIEHRDLLQAASYGFHALTSLERREFLRGAIDLAGVRPSALHEAIVTLGPRCYITTNFDQLLESAHRETWPGSRLDVVTRGMPIEIASIAQARADKFIFKPHGDIGNADSVVLSREDYRQLQHVDKAIMATYRVLLGSRPIVYIGFGLRDPDFLLVKEILGAEFSGGPQDHYAILPDVAQLEIDYWQANYGVQITRYETVPDVGQIGGGHAALLDLIRELGRRAEPAGSSSTTRAREAGRVDELVLARYARGLRKVLEPSDPGTIVPLSATRRPRKSASRTGFAMRERGEVQEFLESFRGIAMLTGPPGSGKSLAVQRAVQSLAQRLEDGCLDPCGPGQSVQIPVYIELREYAGDLRGQIQTSLPAGMSLEDELARGRLVIFLDGVNEVPVEYATRNVLAAQMRDLIGRAGTNSIMFLSRLKDELADFDVDEIAIHEISRDFVATQLRIAGVPFSAELSRMLQRPLFLSIWMNGNLDWSSISNANDVYTQLVGAFAVAIAEDLGVPAVAVREALGTIAFEMLDGGHLTTSVESVFAAFSSVLRGGPDSDELVRVLVARLVMVPTQGRGLAFAHHSIAEYFAAATLARRMTSNSTLAGECLARRTWDQAILLTLGFLSDDDAESLLRAVFASDAFLGARALSYLDDRREAWTLWALENLHQQVLNRPDIAWALGGVLDVMELSGSAAPALRKIEMLGESAGGHAAAQLWRVGSDRDREHISRRFVEWHSDYNYLNRFAESVVDVIAPHAVTAIFDRIACADGLPSPGLDGFEDVGAISSAMATLLREREIGDLIALRRAWDGSPNESVLTAIVLSACRKLDSKEALEYVTHEVRAGTDGAPFALAMQVLDHIDEAVLESVVDRALIDALVNAISHPGDSSWAIDSLRRLTCELPRVGRDLEAIAEADASGLGLLATVLLRFAAGDDDGCARVLGEMIGSTDWSVEPVFALGALQEFWPTRIELLANLLREDQAELSRSLLTSLDFSSFGPGEVEHVAIPDLEYWLSQIVHFAKVDDISAVALSQFVARIADSATVAEMGAAIEASEGPRRFALCRCLLPVMPDVALVNLSNELVDWLVANIENLKPWGSPHPLAVHATEDFVEQRLVPLLVDSRDGPMLRAILVHAGRRHGRRYVDEDGGEVF